LSLGPSPLSATTPARDSDQARKNDMQNFDRLGPLTREVARNAPSEVVVGQMLAAMPIDLYDDDPAVFDRKLAVWLKSQITRKHGKPAEDYVLVRKARRAHG
jgi:hypothetical protein